VVTVLNHAVRLALKATVVATVSKVVAIALKTAVHLHPVLKAVLKVAAISALKVASNPVVTPAANSAALHLAVAKAASSPVAINALTTVVAIALIHATAAHPVLQALQAAVTMRAAAQAIASPPVAPRSLVLVTSSPTMPADTQHLSALALKC
jgi:hypothetical protein